MQIMHYFVYDCVTRLRGAVQEAGDEMYVHVGDYLAAEAVGARKSLWWAVHLAILTVCIWAPLYAGLSKLEVDYKIYSESVDLGDCMYKPWIRMMIRAKCAGLYIGELYGVGERE